MNDVSVTLAATANYFFRVVIPLLKTVSHVKAQKTVENPKMRWNGIQKIRSEVEMSETTRGADKNREWDASWRNPNQHACRRRY